MTHEDDLDTLTRLIAAARAAGADAADAVFFRGTSLTLARRLGKPEHLERSEGADLGLRVFIGRRQAMVSTSDTAPETLEGLVEQAVAMARSVPEDPYCGLAEPDLLAGEVPDLDAFDDAEPTAETLAERAAEAEDAALAVAGVTNSEGAEASWGTTSVAVAASNGFARSYRGSRHGISASVLAGEGMAMERDYDYATAVHGEDLRSPETVGRTAGELAVRRLDPRKVDSGQMPVVYDRRIAGSILGHLAGAINGSAVARGTTFLKDRMGQRIFPDAVTIVDDPLRRRGLRSKPFDGEGVATRPMSLVEKGVLTTWILDLRAARQLGLATTGHASRGTSSPPSPSTTNLYLEPGAIGRDDLIGGIERGLYVTELIGFGVNGVTGDYSRGASGYRIENGEITHSVSEVTVAGNLNDMFRALTAADDLVFEYGTNAPTLCIDAMTVAGT